MVDKLDDNLVEAADARGNPLPVEQEGTHRVFYIYTEQLHQQANQALQMQRDNDAITKGLQQMKKGEGQTIQEVDAELREEFGFPPHA